MSLTPTTLMHNMSNDKWSEGLDKKKGKEKKKKKNKPKAQIDKQGSGEETGCEVEPCEMQYEEMQMQKETKAKLSKDFAKENHNKGPDYVKEEKHKKNRTQLDKLDFEDLIDCEAEPSGKKYEETQVPTQKMKNDKWAENVDKRNDNGGLNGGKEKKKKKHKPQMDEHGSKEGTKSDLVPHGKEVEKNEKNKKRKSSQDFTQGEEEAIRFSKNDEKKRFKSDDNDLDHNDHERRDHRSKDEKKRRKKTKHVIEEEKDCSDGSCVNMIKKKKKKSKLLEPGSEENDGEGGSGCKENVESASLSERLPPKGSSKKVRFSDDVQIFPFASQSGGETNQIDGLIRGKRFSIEEDEMVKKAVLDYIEERRLGDEGLDMVLRCKAFPELKNCWKDIGAALPWRPHSSIYYRAHILFERDEKRKWTPEEYELVRKFHEKHGSDWKTLADALGKHRFHVKDTWRRIKLSNSKKGRWSQDEYQNLFELVNTDLRLKAFEEKKSKHGMLRDNISWGAISDKLSTRSTSLCCLKWYCQLTSPMVEEGKWEDVDDYRLLNALSSLDACSMEDVDWDYLLEHRDGDVCRKRWTQMVKHIGEHGHKSFSEQVEVLSNRYCIDVLDAKEAYNSGPVVD